MAASSFTCTGRDAPAAPGVTVRGAPPVALAPTDSVGRGSGAALPSVCVPLVMAKCSTCDCAYVRACVCMCMRVCVYVCARVLMCVNNGGSLSILFHSMPSTDGFSIHEETGVSMGSCGTTSCGMHLYEGSQSNTNCTISLKPLLRLVTTTQP
eukprot:1160494-Pelagomonas_calceolata.AAC.6